MKENQPLVSIIMPCYNAQDYVAQAIQSALDQTYAHCEVIVIDDGSKDGSLDILKSFGDQITLEAGANQGACAARNRGLDLSKGEYIKFFDADDILTVDCIERQVTLLGLDEGGGQWIGYGYDELFNESGMKVFNKRFPTQSYDPPVADLILRNVITTLSLYPVSAIRKVGGFDARLSSGQERNLNIKLALEGYEFRYQDIFVYSRRIHQSPDRISNRKGDGFKELENVNYTYEVLSGHKDQRILDAWAAYLWTLGRRFGFDGDAKAARAFFDEAKKVSPAGYRRYLTPKYSMLLSVFDPILIDRVYGVIRIFKSSNKNELDRVTFKR